MTCKSTISCSLASILPLISGELLAKSPVVDAGLIPWLDSSFSLPALVTYHVGNRFLNQCKGMVFCQGTLVDLHLHTFGSRRSVYV